MCSSTFATAASSISGPCSTPSSKPWPTRRALTAAEKLLDERVVDPVLHEDPVGADARLTHVAELRRDRSLDRDVEVGVVEDDQRRVAAELERDLLHGARRTSPSAACRPRSSPVNVSLRIVGFVASSSPTTGAEPGHHGEHAGRQARPRRRAPPARAPRAASRSRASAPSCSRRRSPGPALRGIIAIGKFHGVIAAQTPIGCLSDEEPPVGQCSAGSSRRRRAWPPRRTTR